MTFDQEPTRLLDDPNQPEALRAALREAADAPPAIDVAAGAKALEASLAKTATGGSALVAKVASLVAVAALGGGLVVLSSSPRSGAPALPPATRGPESQGVQPAAPEVPPPAAPHLEPVATPEPAAPPAITPPRPVVRARPAPRATAGDALRLEMSRLAEARRVLRSDPASALRILDELGQTRPDGVFLEEREALSVLALAALRRPREARLRGERWLASYPRGAYAESIRAAMAGQ